MSIFFYFGIFQYYLFLKNIFDDHPMQENVGNNLEKNVENEFDNVLNLSENATKMDALKAYSEFKISLEHSIKMGNLSSEEISHREALLNVARAQCLALLYQEVECCAVNCSCVEPDHDCRNHECGICADYYYEDEETGCCGGCCESDEETGCCGGCCESDEDCCQDNQFVKEDCCEHENILPNDEEECLDETKVEGENQKEESCHASESTENLYRADIGMRPIEGSEKQERDIKILFDQAGLLKTSEVIEDIEEKKNGFCGFKFFCF